MAGRGKKLTFHGAFSSKRKAVQKERSVGNAFIRRVKIKGGIRYVVMKKKRG